MSRAHASSISVRLTVTVLLAGCAQVFSVATSRTHHSPTSSPAPKAVTAATQALRDLPLAFEANVGQTDSQVRFLARRPGAGVFLTERGAVLSLRSSEDATVGAAVHLTPVGSDPSAHAVGLEPLAGRVNYLLGRDEADWRRGVPTYAKVAQQGVYPGIDFVYYGAAGQLEYDVVVAPGADASAVRLAIDGARNLRLSPEGDLLIDTAAGLLVHHRPVAYQDVDGARRPVAAQYVLGDNAEVGIRPGAYDPSRPLVIDPVVTYATYLGGDSFDSVQHVDVDSTGAAYVTGFTGTSATQFPVTPGAFDTAFSGNRDAFVTKLAPNGASLIWSTYLGGTGTGTETGFAIAVDAAGSAYVTGNTTSADFPVTQGAFDTTWGGAAPNFSPDVFVTRLAPDGASLLWSTYLGGVGDEQPNTPGIALDGAGSVFVVGQTSSSGFPTTAGAFQTTLALPGSQDAFVTKFSSAGALEWSTFLGEPGNVASDSAFGVAVDATGVYVSGSTTSANFPTTPGAFDTAFAGAPGSDGFVTKLNLTGSALVYSTFLGGAGGDVAYAVAVDSSGFAYVAGSGAAGFPTTPGAFDTTNNGGDDGFVAKLQPDGASLVFSTFIGGSATDSFTGIAVDAAGTAFVTGTTFGGTYPVTGDALDPSFTGGSDAMLTQVAANGSSLIYSSFLGGGGTETGRGPALDGLGGVWVVGATGSPDFPTTPGAFDTILGGSSDGFVIKFAFPAPPVIFPLSLPGVVTSSTNWALQTTLTTGGPTITFTYGVRPLVPIMGDWDGNGSKTPGTFEAGTFKLSNSTTGPSPAVATTFSFGDPRGFPVVGDWNGDGTDDVAVFKAGTWQTRITGSGATATFSFGPALTWPSVVPVAGDWDGDGTDGIGTYNLMAAAGTVGQWNLRQVASAGAADAGTFVYNPGTSPYPVVGDWDANGTSTVGVKTGTTPATWMLNNANDASGADITFDFGVAGDFPVVWAQ